MYFKVLKEGFTYTSPIGQRQSAPVGAIIKVENLIDSEKLQASKHIEKYDAFKAKGVMTEKSVTADTNNKNPEKEVAKYAVGDLVEANYEDDDNEPQVGKGEIIKLTKKGIRVDFQEKDQNYRIIQDKDIIKVF